METDDLPCKIQSDPESFLDGHPAAPVESPEDLVFFPRLDAKSIVTHLKLRKHFILLQSHLDTAARGAVFYRIVKDIKERFPQPVRIMGTDCLIRHTDLEADLFLLRRFWICPKVF